jgi:hypothetical protein
LELNKDDDASDLNGKNELDFDRTGSFGEKWDECDNLNGKNEELDDRTNLFSQGNSYLKSLKTCQKFFF